MGSHLVFSPKEALRKASLSLGGRWVRIFALGIVLAVACGAVDFGEPLEDIMRAGRNAIRARAADQSIVVVGVDDKTIARIGGDDHARRYDAQLVETVLKAGAKSVVFDRIFARPSAYGDDAAFASELARERGRAYIGIGTSYRNGVTEPFGPTPSLRKAASIAALIGIETPFSLSAKLMHAADVEGVRYQSASTILAGQVSDKSSLYRPDWSIQVRTIPTVSFVDVVEGQVDPRLFKGRSVIVGDTAFELHDFHKVAGQGWFPGVYAHVVGAQTLREGHPLDWGFMPPFALALGIAVVAAFMRTRQRFLQMMLAIAFGLLGLSFWADSQFVTMDYIPSLLALGLIGARGFVYLGETQARAVNARSGLGNLNAMAQLDGQPVGVVLALRIRNYADLSALLGRVVDQVIVPEMARRVLVSDAGHKAYHEHDVIYWTMDTLSEVELEDHLRSLVLLLQHAVTISGHIFDVQFAIGYCDTPAPVTATRASVALASADLAVAEGRLVGTRVDLPTDSDWRVSMMSDLDVGMRRGDVWVAYQPQIDLANGEVCGVEALVRWTHPERGVINTQTFVTACEAFNRTMPLTLFVLRKAAQGILSLGKAGENLRLSVNLSAGLLTDATLVPTLVSVLGATDFPLSRLTLEVTETARVQESRLALAALKQLSDLGIQIAIDDYGTGNATLDYLRAMPCSEVKLDRSFIHRLADDNRDRLMVQSTISLAHAMGCKVVAEGVENQGISNILAGMGCDIGQGFHYAKPLKLADLKDFVGAETRSLRKTA